MKLTFLITIIFITSYSSAQVQSWPPGGQQPSPYALLLPDSRFVPSTKRYNLIWADQFYGLPSGKIEFVAKNYAGTQKIFNYQADDYRAFNSNFLVLSYHLALGLNPHQNDDCPFPHNNPGTGFIGVIAPAGYVSEWDTYFLPWLSSHSIPVGSNQYEQMFQHYDTMYTAHRVWHIDPQWLMNADNPDWRTYIGDQCVDWMNGNENEGCFLDVSVETMVSPLYNPNAGDPAPYNFNWYITPHSPFGYTVNSLNDFATYMNDRYADYYQVLYSRFHSALVDYLVIPNVDQMVTGWYDPVWLDGTSGETIDGAMMESFGNYTGSDMYLTLERGLRHITGRGKILIAQFYNNSQQERYRRTGMYMLIKNENSFINIADGTVNWFPEYEIDLGNQSTVPPVIDSLRISGTGSNSLFKRNYAQGMVLCNTSSNTLMYSLSGSGWNKIVTSGGGAVNNNGQTASQNIQLVPVSGSVSVAPSDCIILKNNSSTGYEESNDSENDFIVSEDLNSGEVTIKIKIDFSASFSINVYDINGRIVKNIFTGELNKEEKIFTCNLNELSKGTYFIRSTGGINVTKKVLKF